MYCEILSLGVDIQQKLTSFLSHLLKKGASLLPTLDEIEENEISALEYAESKAIFVGSFNVDLMELIREENEEMRRRNAFLRERIKIAKQR